MNGKQEATFALRLRKRASQYFRDFKQDEVTVRLVNKQTRSESVLYRFDLSVRDVHRSVMVKVPNNHSENIENQSSGLGQVTDGRPRLAPIPDSAKKYQLEYAALNEIRDYFSDLDDPRFGTIRILDFFSDHMAIVMEESSASSLRQLFMKAGRLRRSLTAINLDVPFRNTGAWLHTYHGLRKCKSVKIRHSQRTEFIDTIIKLTDFLASTCGNEPFFQFVKSKTVSYAQRELPESLPLGVRHGDFAPRNILVGPDNRVIVLDTLAKWCMPIYSDIAYFLVALRTNRAQVLGQGLAFSPKYIARCEKEFLTGYFDQKPIPYKTIQLYEVQALLDKWSAVATRLDIKPTPGRTIFPEKLQLVLSNRFFRQNINRLLQNIDRV